MTLELHNLSDRDLLILTVQKVAIIEERITTSNGIVAELKQGYYRLQGALAVLLFLITVGIALASVVATQM